jgi:hypothetical protein
VVNGGSEMVMNTGSLMVMITDSELAVNRKVKKMVMNR